MNIGFYFRLQIFCDVNYELTVCKFIWTIYVFIEFSIFFQHMYSYIWHASCNCGWRSQVPLFVLFMAPRGTWVEPQTWTIYDLCVCMDVYWTRKFLVIYIFIFDRHQCFLVLILYIKWIVVFMFKRIESA